MPLRPLLEIRSGYWISPMRCKRWGLFYFFFPDKSTIWTQAPLRIPDSILDMLFNVCTLVWRLGLISSVLQKAKTWLKMKCCTYYSLNASPTSRAWWKSRNDFLSTLGMSGVKKVFTRLKMWIAVPFKKSGSCQLLPCLPCRKRSEHDLFFFLFKMNSWSVHLWGEKFFLRKLFKKVHKAYVWN